MVVIFAIIFFILAKFAWKPIMNMLKKREDSISEALQAADIARHEMSKLQAEHEQMLQDARVERDKLMAEARSIREQMIAKAREEASLEAAKLVDQSRKQIEGEKLSAINEIQQQVAVLSVGIAEKILRRELKDRSSQEALIQDQLRDLKLN